MQFITDRSHADFGTDRGYYNYTDMNRVESAVEAICAVLKGQGADLGLTVKTDWRMDGSYPDNWPTAAQLQRYLDNVAQIRSHFGVAIQLPQTMSNLTYAGANAIEQVLEAAWQILFPQQINQEEHINE